MLSDIPGSMLGEPGRERLWDTKEVYFRCALSRDAMSPEPAYEADGNMRGRAKMSRVGSGYIVGAVVPRSKSGPS
jgi:hypothetical protein